MSQNIFTLAGLSFDKNQNIKNEKDFVYYLRNADMSDYTNTDSFSFVQNANSNKLCVKFPNNYQYKGHIKLDLDEFLLFLYDGLNSSIFLFNEKLCTLIKIGSANCFDFTNRVYGVYKYNEGKRSCYFVDGKSIRCINLANIPYVQLEKCDSCQNVTSDIIDCEELNIFKNFTPPNIEGVVTEGNIPSGVYQFAISRAENKDNDDWFIYSKRYNLHGLNGNDERFGFQLTIDCLNYSGEFKVALIAHREDRGTVAQEIGIFPTTTKIINITELDSTYYFPISNEQLLSVDTIYQSADYISTNSEHLILGALKERADVNYQKQANLIQSEVGVFKVSANKAHLYPSFQSNENYAFTIRGLYKDNQKTNWFNIPNNSIPSDEWFENVNEQNNLDVWSDECNPQIKKKWEVYNSASLIEVKEANDNGSLQSVIVNNSNCKTYKIQTTSNYWRGTLTYLDCDGILITLQDVLPNITFCTQNIEQATWTFDSFNKVQDLIQISERGRCNEIVGTNCTKYRLSDKYTAFGDVNCGNIIYTKCNVIDNLGTPVETCTVFEEYSGNISGFEFCACYNSGDIYGFDIEVTPCAFSFQELGTCGSEFNNIERDGTQCDYQLVARSTFAYHETDIKYPTDNFNNLPRFEPCKTGVRLHKFPDRTQFLGNKRFPHIHSSTESTNAKEYVYILAPRFYNISPFLDCQNNVIKDIIGYQIGYKSRDNNKTVIHSGMLFNMKEENLPDCTVSYFPNYPFNDLQKDEFIGTYELLKAGNVNPKKQRGRFVNQTAYSKSKFQYVSPDIQYQKNDQAPTELITMREELGYVKGEFNQTDEIPKVVVMSDAMYSVLANLASISIGIGFIPFINVPFSVSDIIITLPETLHKLLSGKNYAYNIVQESNYSKSTIENVKQGNRRRKIEDSFYLQPTRLKHQGIKVNNFQREGGLFLNLNEEIENPSVQEKSRVRYSDVNNLIFADSTQSDLKTSSYYVQLKKENKTQYGGLNDGLVRPLSDLIKTSDSTFNFYDSGYLINGDIYITKHKFIKKFPFFTKLPLNAPFDTPYVLSDSLNVGYPRYWIDVVDRNETLNVITKNKIARLIQSISGYDGNNYFLEAVGNPIKSNCNQAAKTNSTFGLVNGMFYTHIIGIVEYYCESEYIGGYREINEVPQSNYNRDILEIKQYNNVLYPERFLYNQQHRYKGIYSQYKMFDLSKDCCDNLTYSQDRIIFSLKSDPLSKSDKWKKFLPNNYHQFAHQDGNLKGIIAVNNYNLLFLFDNASYISQTDDGINTKNGTIYLGVGSIFERRLKKISSEINGLGGCIDLDSVVNTPFGTYWADRNRKTFIFFDGNTIQEINNNLKKMTKLIYPIISMKKVN